MTKNIADNPAHRLHEILKQCKETAAGENCRSVWRRILRTEDEGELLARIAKLLYLSREVVDIVNDSFSKHLQSIQTLHLQLKTGITQQNLNGQWASFISHVHDHSIVSLGFTASLLEEREKLQAVDISSLSDQRDKLVELRKEIVSSNELPDDVKLTIVRYLGRLIECLDEYFITGIFPVLDATNTAIGNVAFDEAYGRVLQDTALGQKVASALANVANSVTIATGMLQLAEPVAHLLKLLPGNS
ncbi:hypothetical protein GXB81_18635 [Paraburkholderia sp. Ac-20336]|uniref:hypothetical protein n=1 Tax=Burkholderiaceae TaxID=119060 RepID=UPI001420640B|nr:MULTISPECIES: hypothetical protein [Burkholderiaceae]MBN3805051.1 hypothetical protein [Paraburkholderia sp. Ac-20336]MBN3848927.1 hypothetical protein [Paraburkholderia sp. Ac-20342]NIF54670.1 hypothetical protein [Burkholderia sp. Ax-1724]